MKACIFDLDGVIVDTARFHYLAWKRLADELGISFSELDNERLKGVSRMDSLDIILSLGNQTLSAQEKLQAAEKKNQWFLEYVNTMTPQDVLPGAIQLLEQLQRNNIRIALASSSKNANTVLQLVNVSHFFEVVVDGTMVKQAKPDPEIFLLAASRLGVEPSESCVFEDAEAGVEAAVKAGMFCVGIGSPVQLSKADVVVKSLLDFQYQNLLSLTKQKV